MAQITMEVEFDATLDDDMEIVFDRAKDAFNENMIDGYVLEFKTIRLLEEKAANDAGRAT